MSDPNTQPAVVTRSAELYTALSAMRFQDSMPG